MLDVQACSTAQLFELIVSSEILTEFRRARNQSTTSIAERDHDIDKRVNVRLWVTQ